MQAEFETIAYDAKLPEEERTELDSIEKWRLLRHLSRLDLKHFSHTVLERDSSLLYAACEMFRGEDPAAEVMLLYLSLLLSFPLSFCLYVCTCLLLF